MFSFHFKVTKATTKQFIAFQMESFPAAEIENDPDESLVDVHPLSQDAPLEENQHDTNPEWKLSEEEAEMDDDGDDEEKDKPVTRNTIK